MADNDAKLDELRDKLMGQLARLMFYGEPRSTRSRGIVTKVEKSWIKDEFKVTFDNRDEVWFVGVDGWTLELYDGRVLP